MKTPISAGPYERPSHLKSVLLEDGLVALADNPADIRQAAAGLKSRIEAIHRILNGPAAHPALRVKAKDDLVVLSREALSLWALL